MRRSRFFRPLIIVAATCSLAGLAREIVPLPGLPDVDHIAPVQAATVTEVPAATVVIEELAQAQATPTPARDEAETAPTEPEPAVATGVASIPTNLDHAVDLSSHDDKAGALLDRMNNARLAEGGRALRADADLDDVALARARNLVANGYFDHYAPDGESAFSELGARGISYRLAGENLARNNYAENRTLQAAFDGLMASPGHRANILEARFSLVGIAVVQSGKMWIYVTVFMD